MSKEFYLILGEEEHTSNETIWIKSNYYLSNDYSLIYNDGLITNSRLSLKAIGLASLIMSKAGGIIEQKKIIDTTFKDKYNSVKTGWDELIKVGFLSKAQYYKSGRIKGTLWVVNEMFNEYNHLTAAALDLYQREKNEILIEDGLNTIFPELYIFLDPVKLKKGFAERRKNQKLLLEYFSKSEYRFVCKTDIMGLGKEGILNSRYTCKTESTKSLYEKATYVPPKTF